MLPSILDTIKAMLGINDSAFDEDITVNINSAFMNLNQLGVGPETVFSIEDDTEVWTDFLDVDLEKYQAVKTYIYIYVKLAFDPPSASFILSALENQKRELEWRLSVQVPIEA